jgi:hypothetical protein
VKEVTDGDLGCTKESTPCGPAKSPTPCVNSPPSKPPLMPFTHNSASLNQNTTVCNKPESLSHPADVMVSKLNSDRQKGEGAGKAIGRIYKVIGFSGLWNGLSTRILMIGTLTAFQVRA